MPIQEDADDVPSRHTSVRTEDGLDSQTTADQGDQFLSLATRLIKPTGEWCWQTRGLPEDEPPGIIHWYEAPDPKLGHDFLRWLQKSAESSSHWLASKYFFHGMLDDYWWRVIHFGKNHHYLWAKLWTAPGRIELDHWAFFFAFFARFQDIDELVLDPVVLSAGSLGAVCKGAQQLRHSAVHRQKLNIVHLENAMRLPALFRDNARAAEIERVYRLMCEYPRLDNKTRKDLEKTLSDSAATEGYEVLYQVQTLLEEISFREAQRTEPELLARENWTVPEQIELIDWEKHWDLEKCANDPIYIEDRDKFYARKASATL